MQTSAKTVSQNTVDTIENQFYKALANYKNDTDLKAFLLEFLSETERSVMIKRFAILLMLEEGKSYTAIEEELKVSSATVSTVSKLSQEPAIKILLKDIEADDWAATMSAKFIEKFSFLKKKDSAVIPTETTESTSMLKPMNDSTPVLTEEKPITNDQ